MQLKIVEIAYCIQIKLFQSNKAARSSHPPMPRVSQRVPVPGAACRDPPSYDVRCLPRFGTTVTSAMLNRGLFPETSGYVTAPKLRCIFRCFMRHAEA